MGILKPQFIVQWWYTNDRSRDSHEQKSLKVFTYLTHKMSLLKRQSSLTFEVIISCLVFSTIEVYY